MELQTVLELVKAGFTKDEIMQMAQPSTPNTDPEPVQPQVEIPAQTTEPNPVQAQVAEPVAVAVPEAVPQPVQTPAQNSPTLGDIMQGIAKLTSAVQANAIAQSVIPNGIQHNPTAEDMLAEIIRPTYRKEDN